MADININKFRTSVVREGSRPASAGFVESEGQDPVDPAGSTQNHLPVTIAPAATALSITDSQVLGGAGTVAQYVRGDGSLADFPQSIGSGASVSYYLNGSVNQGTIGGVTYYEMNKTPIIGAGTDFSRNSNGYIASFLTDANDPSLLVIPAGNWNFETYFEASSGGGSPTFYLELYKYDGTTFTLVASNSGAPKLINDGTSIEAYFSALAVPQTTLTLTDRLAIRIYVTTAGRTITLHTENSHLCQVITTFTTGLSALNGLTSQVQFFAVGTTGTDFNIASATDTHTFNLPTASATNRGALASADWTTFNNKQNQLNGTGFVKASGTTITYDNSTYQVTSEKGQPNGYASLDGNGKVPLAQINDALIGNVNYQGLWNAATNNPTLANPPSSGTKGYYYIVSTAGTFASISFEVGDWIISNGSAWQKVDNTDAVSSVFGRTGNVIAANGDYNTSQVTELTNLYYTEARVSANTDVAANTAARHNAVTLGTANGLSLSTQQLSLQLASGSQNGALSSTDWTTFNNKENAITAGTTAQYFRGDKTFQTLNTAAVPELTNLYYTEARVSANTDVAANTAARHAAVTLGTANGLSLSTQQLSLGLASAGVTGALSGTDWSTFNSKQQALNGTGFVKISGTTISYDNSTYLTTAAAASTYLPLAGGTMTGNINWAQTDRGIVWSFNTDGASIKFYNTGDGDTDSRLEFATLDNNDEYFRWGHIPSGGSFYESMRLKPIGSGSAELIVTGKIIKSGGTSSQFLKADGSVDSNTYYLASNPSAFIALTALSGTAPIQYNNTTGAISITQASGSTNGFLSSTDWNTFNNKTSNVGTVTSVAALTLGTSGTDLSSSVANGTTTPVITLNVPTASAANRGALSAADWTTFNGKQDNIVAGTTVQYYRGDKTFQTLNTSAVPELTNLYYTEARVNANTNVAANTAARHNAVTLGTANGLSLSTQQLSLGLASSSANGALSSTDWTTFNNKQNALTNPVTGTGTTNFLPKFTGASTIGDSVIQEVSGNILIGNNTASATTTPVYLSTGGTYGTTLANGIKIKLFESGGVSHGIGVIAGNLYLNSTDNTTYITLNTNNTERLRIDTSGNLGLGVTPSAWSIGTALEIANGPAILGFVNETFIANNAYFNAGWKYRANVTAQSYWMSGGEHRWYNAPSGTAGNAISFTQAMTLFASGNLGVGPTTDAGFKLDVNGTGRFSGDLSVGSGSGSVSLAINRGAAANGNGLRFQTAATNNWYIGSAATSTNTDLEIYNHNTATTNLRLSYSTGAATFSNNVTASGTGNIVIQAISSNNFPLFQLQDNRSGGAVWNIEGGRTLGNLQFRSNIFGNTVLELASSGAATFSGPVLIDSVVNANQGNLVITSTNNDASGLSLKVRSSPSDPTNSRSWMIHSNYSEAGTFEILRSTTATGNPTTFALKLNGSTGAATFSSSVTIQSANTLKFNNSGNTGSGEIVCPGGGSLSLRAYNQEMIALIESDHIKFSTATVERMRITSGGNVGIGTASPSQKLEVSGGAIIASGFGNRAAGTGKALEIGMDGTNAVLQAYDRTANAFIPIYISSSQTIIPTGNVLIGTTTDSGFKLDVNGTGRFSGALTIGADFFISSSTAAIVFNSSANFNTQIYQTGGSLVLYTGANPRLTIASTGAATFSSSVTAASIIRSGGTSSQYLMADGSVSTLSNPVTGTGSAGQVAYWSSGSAITGESNLFWDATNDRLGIGRNNPSQRLDILGSGTVYANIENSGANIAAVITKNTSKTFTTGLVTDYWAVIDSTSGSNTRLMIESGGNVLINTTTNVTGANLNVNGNIRTAAPTGGSAENWKLGNAVNGTVNANRLIRVEIAGVGYDLVARQII